MSNEPKEEEEQPSCKYCKTMWFELQSEGSQCGIDGCSTYTCCDKAWQDHVKQCHPMELIKDILRQNNLQYKNTRYAINEKLVLVTDISIDIHYLLGQTYSLKTSHITIELKENELDHLMSCIEKIWNIEKMFQLETEAKLNDK